MKNIQVIDHAINCAYDVYRVTEEEFSRIFPESEQDIQFIEDLGDDEDITQILTRMWKRRLKKPEINGIHGTLFYQLAEKKRFYPTKREIDLTIGHGRPQD
ncbi:MAG: hypothetical protein HC936_08330 [Leptolyngbyaceae cyanobacterium SU_3_3]|nr:hypothetical protein [Leptolyngbyaceae cyanobacterium SU_3_3]NJR50431.1 hypothetical protein [Leptolyngbyaceae cyanobacterium CSU_1_3]